MKCWQMTTNETLSMLTRNGKICGHIKRSWSTRLKCEIVQKRHDILHIIYVAGSGVWETTPPPPPPPKKLKMASPK